MASGENRPSVLDEFLDRADIVDVAQRLGLQIDRKRTRPQRALCPFHNDTTPSLNLFEARDGDTPHYHCFACGAHGDLIDLVRGVKRMDFLEARRWLAEVLGVPLPNAYVVRVDTRTATSALVSLITQAQSDRFTAFCDKRGFPEDFLKRHGIGVVTLNSLIERARNDKVFAENLIESGIARRVETTGPQDEFWRNGIRGVNFR